ncbi:MULTISPECIES: SRPBCC domain-containing protein [Exiguobacterium]|uniref:SRPBCC domain-containing protein n=1 Tax=Exiguobacterium TaxID=33986 RepID=UPI001BE6325E|nr:MULTISPECIES: SRPBCC domain-containing protein [Exiguobacterium]MCT4783269.1 SRPBCC domain-containing protein [Exiguobacterium himgiriensis]
MKGRIDTSSKWIPFSSKEIYESFLDPRRLEKWLAPKGMCAQIDVFDPLAGGMYRIVLTYEDETVTGKTSLHTDVSKGRFVKLETNQKIVMAGIFETEDPSFSGEMVQTWYLEEMDDGTNVTIVCENVPSGILKEDHLSGLGATLNQLSDFLKGKTSE